MSGSLFSLADAAPPSVGIELASHRVSAVSIDVRAGKPVVVAHAMERLPEGAIVPSLTASNVRDRQVVLTAIRGVLERVGGAKRVGLIVPDTIARVSIVKFQQVPARAEDLAQLIRWQVRKAVPFPIEDTQVSFVPAGMSPEGQDFIVSLARKDIVAEYEGVCAAAGAHAGLVDLSTFNVINAVTASGGAIPGDWLLVNVAPDWASIAVIRGEHLIFFRSRGAEAEETLTDLVHQAAMYYEDRLGGTQFQRVLLCGAGTGAGAQTDALRRDLQERLRARVDSVDPRAAAAFDSVGSDATGMMDALTPLVGLLVRDREAA